LEWKCVTGGVEVVQLVGRLDEPVGISPTPMLCRLCAPKSLTANVIGSETVAARNNSDTWSPHR
jgi:hypothetical protein